MKDKEDILQNFAFKVRDLRQKKGVTQANAFNDTGIHFGRIEQGKRDVSLTTLTKIATYFDVNIGELVD
ncbi:MAG: helix-turn-helix domain-containing protein [Flavobacteriales bacterium]|nr:helix-turn-helix domain-containing protein [Flavobacteriales bacterium]